MTWTSSTDALTRSSGPIRIARHMSAATALAASRIAGAAADMWRAIRIGPLLRVKASVEDVQVMAGIPWL
jgi:hypothetical protein